ncbi:MAG: FKBP-type peptidyl-prolyl cis-trans isomerase [Thiotrichales bacterium]
MKVENKKIVMLNLTMKDDQDVLIEELTDGSFGYLHGAGNIIPGLEQALEGKSAGDEITVTLTPEDAYGEIDPDQIQQVPRNMFPADTEIQPGMQFHAETPEGHPMIVTVTHAEGDTVVIDGNHPLAGVTLKCDASIVAVRDATEEELSHGHMHSSGGSCSHG